tara:strand:- start:277 stop:510 length:234 start_codon:yes stop_codon:yes gene_type:complete
MLKNLKPKKTRSFLQLTKIKKRKRFQRLMMPLPKMTKQPHLRNLMKLRMPNPKRDHWTKFLTKKDLPPRLRPKDLKE